jgi:hypothetical protein
MMKWLFIVLLLCGCGVPTQEPIQVLYGAPRFELSNSSWEELNGKRKFAFETTTVTDYRRDFPSDPWQVVGVYRYEVGGSWVRFTKENHEVVDAQLDFTDASEFQVLKYNGIINWVPATHRRVFD